MLFKPPDAELLLVHTAPINDMVVAIRIAPEFIREVKNIREEIRNVDKRLTFSHHVAHCHPPLLHSVIPVLHSHAAMENLIRVVGDITGSPDARHTGLQEFIDLDSVACVQRCPVKQVHGRCHSNTRHDKVRWHFISRCQYDLALAVLMRQGNHLVAFHKGDAMPGKLTLKKR